MFPLFPFAVGLLTGAAAIKLVRSGKAKKQIEETQDYLRHATISGLNVIEQSSARLRGRLQPVADAPQEDTSAAKRAKPAAKPVAKRRAPAAKAKAAPAKKKDEA